MTLKNIHFHFDQLGRKVAIPIHPQRIISLVPSQTELLFDLGLEKRIVGITKFCVHPKESCSQKKKIGGTKKLHLDWIKNLQPDLIIANKEENTKDDIEALAKKYPVWCSNILNLEDAYEMMRKIGEITDTEEKANEIVQDIQNKFDQLSRLPPKKVTYLIWYKPMMAAGKKTFIDELLTKCGFVNAVEETRYPILKNIDTDLVLLSSEPFPFQTKHIPEIKKIFTGAKVELVDGEMFSWYGSRLLYFPDYVNSRFKDLRSSQNPG